KNGKVPCRKSSKSLSSTTSSSSSSSTKSESDDQQGPPTRSILRHSCISKYKPHQKPQSQPKTDDKKEFDYWKQTIEQRKRANYDRNSHSDSESSDITNSSGDCVDCHP